MSKKERKGREKRGEKRNKREGRICIHNPPHSSLQLCANQKPNGWKRVGPMLKCVSSVLSCLAAKVWSRRMPRGHSFLCFPPEGICQDCSNCSLQTQQGLLRNLCHSCLATVWSVLGSQMKLVPEDFYVYLQYIWKLSLSWKHSFNYTDFHPASFSSGGELLFWKVH